MCSGSAVNRPLGRAGTQAVRWSVLTSAARLVLQLLIQVWLARMLGPQVFGIFAIGLVTLTLAGFLAGFGLSWNLMQRAQLEEADIRFAWTWQLLMGLAALLALQALAPLIAQTMREPAAEAVIRWMSLGCLLQAAAAPATHLLTRALDFRSLGLIQLLSYLVGYGLVGLPLAWNHAGVNALLCAWLVQAALVTGASLWVRPHAFTPLLWYGRAREMLGVGQAVFMTNLVNWTLNHLDRLFIGRLLGTWSLGLYNVAYNLASVPSQILLGALQPAFVAAGAQMRAEPGRLAQAYLQMLATLMVLGIPAGLALALLAPDLMGLLYGARWLEASPVLACLLAAMPLLAIWGISTPVLWNTGRSHHEWLLQLPLLALGALALWIAAPWGLTYAAVATATLVLLRAALLVGAALRALQVPASALSPHALRALVLSLAAAAAVLSVQALIVSPVLRLLVSAALPLFLIGLLWWLQPHALQRALGAPTWAMVLRFAPSLHRRDLHGRASAA